MNQSLIWIQVLQHILFLTDGDTNTSYHNTYHNIQKEVKASYTDNTPVSNTT